MLSKFKSAVNIYLDTMTLKKSLTLTSLIIIFVVIFSGVAVYHKHNLDSAHAEQLIAIDTIYPSEQGLPSGKLLEKFPYKVDDNYLYFNDRIVEKFSYSQESIDGNIKGINNLFNAIPDNINSYVMLVPGRIIVEDGYPEQSDIINSAVNQVYSQLLDKITPLQITPTFIDHKSEYLHFRTRDSFTALGTYYASTVFANAAKVTMSDISQYEEYHLENYLGKYAHLPNSTLNDAVGDTVTYYIKKDSANSQTVTMLKSNNITNTFVAPTIALSRRGTDIFLGGNISHSILKGDTNNGKTLLIVGDSSGKIIAPWLADAYENVYYISTNLYNGDYSTFQQIFKNYQVSDCLYLQSLTNFNNSRYYKKLTNLWS